VKDRLSPRRGLQNIDDQGRKPQRLLDHSKHQNTRNDRDPLPPDEGKAGPERAFGKPAQYVGRKQRGNDNQMRLPVQFGKLFQADRLKSPAIGLPLAGILKADALMPVVDEADDGNRRRRQAFCPVAQPIECGVGRRQKCLCFLLPPDHGAETQRFGVGAVERLAALRVNGEPLDRRDPGQFVIQCKEWGAESERWPDTCEDLEY